MTPSAGPEPNPAESSSRPIVRRWWLNLALLVIVAALVTFAWYRSSRPPTEARPSLTEINPDSIRRVQIERPRETPITLERSDGSWQLTAPLKARADTLAVESLLRLARAPIDATVTPAQGDLARYGLEQPSLTVRFDDVEIRFGQLHPLKDEHYVQRGTTVHLIASGYYRTSAAKYTNLIDSRLIEPGRKPIAFRLPGFTLTLTDGTWQRKPEIPALSSDRINAFVDDWRHARALQVEKYSGRKALDAVVVDVEETNGQRSALTIAVLERDSRLVLARPDEGLEYHFPRETARRLFNLNTDEAK